MSRLASFFDDVLQFLWSTSPTTATSVGIHEHDHRLVDLDPGAVAWRVRTIRSFRSELEALIASERRPAPEELLDARVLADTLEVEARLLEELRAPSRDPGAYLEEILYGVYYLVQREFAPLPERAERLRRRLREVPRLLRQGEENLRDPAAIPPPWVEAAIEQAEGSQRYLHQVERDVVPRAGAAAGDLRAALGAAREAIDRFARHLVGTLRPAARGDFAIGTDLFEFLLRTQHGLDLDAAGLRRLGEDLIARTQERLAESVRALAPGRSWRDLVVSWKSDHPSAETFLDDYRREVERARAFVAARGLVSLPADDRLEVVATPAFQRALCPLAAYLAPAPFEAFQEGYLWVTPPEEGAPPEAQERHLQDHLRPAMAGTSAHEAYPGHHVQIGLANRIGSRVRRAFATPVLVEGWAFYCEELMAEQGYYEDPRSRVLQLKDELWRACRVVIDVGLHTGGMSLEEAMAMLRDVASLEASSALGEARRYTRMPTQPMSYVAGKHEILRLREEYRRRRGAAFSLREFHDRLLSFGSIPIGLIRERLLGSADAPGA